jgi:hypothetical protein
MRASPVVTPDRRQTPRTKLVEIAYIGMGPENGGLVLDVSDGGLSFHSVAPVREAETINFLLSLRGHSRIHGSGEVVWTNDVKTVCGMRFTSLSAGAREHISNWTNQSRIAVTPREEVISAAPPDITHIEDSLDTPGGQSDTEAESVFANPSPDEVYLSAPASRSLFIHPLFFWIMFGILGSAFVVTAFVYGLRVGKAQIKSNSQSTVVADSGPNPQAPESDAASASSATSDAPSVSASGPALLSGDVTPVHGGVPSVPNAETSHISGAYMNASRTDSINADQLPRLTGDAGIAADKQQHAEMALEAGESELAAALASLRGTNGVRDSSKAVRLLWAAVANDNSTAAVVLADLYLRGDGVAKSCEQGRVLLTVASKSGDVQGREKLKDLNTNGCP